MPNIKLYIFAAIGIVYSGLIFYLGGLPEKAKYAALQTHTEAARAAQLQAVINAMTAHDKQAQDDHDKLQRVVDQYDTEKLLPPITTGIVERMRIVESTSCASGSKLPSAPIVAGRVETASRVPSSNAELDRLSQAAFDAADRDAERLNAIVKLAP